MKKLAFIMPVAILCGAAWVVTALAQNKPSAEDEIRKADAAYIAAFARRDAKALAALWSDEAEYVNPTTGQRARGRAAIERQFAEIFEMSGEAKIELSNVTVRLLTSDVAVEEGSARVTRPGAAPEVSTYTAIFVKKDGQWLLDTVRETDLPGPPSHAERLAGLDWLVGDWSSESGNVQSTFAWDKNQNFLKMTFSANEEGELDMEGTQFIGWDPVRQQVRAWLFDTDGGFAESIWTPEDQRWVVKSVSTLPDGRLASSVNIYTRVDESTLTWESTGREVDGDIQPNVGPITIKRKSGSASAEPPTSRSE
jgi:uncharacterized protein (TIGR02246 family)